MSTQQLTQQAMALPLAERVSLAQALWESIDVGLPDSEENAFLIEAIRRDEELDNATVIGRSHEDVMKAARLAIGCA